MLEKKQFRAWAKANDVVILAFLKERNSGEVFGIGVKTKKDYRGQPYYTFGRVWNVFADQFTYDQCGCATFDDEMEVRKHAYQFFGLN